jgi:hypothetical protein
MCVLHTALHLHVCTAYCIVLACVSCILLCTRMCVLHTALYLHGRSTMAAVAAAAAGKFLPLRAMWVAPSGSCCMTLSMTSTGGPAVAQHPLSVPHPLLQTQPLPGPAVYSTVQHRLLGVFGFWNYRGSCDVCLHWIQRRMVAVWCFAQSTASLHA